MFLNKDDDDDDDDDVTRVGGLPYLRARVTLVGGLTFPCM